MSKNYYSHESSYIDEGARIGAGTSIWHFCHVYGSSTVGQNCTLGQNVMIGEQVVVGDGCKIQNNVSIYRGVTLEENVFCGPSVVFTNVINPRANVDRAKEFKVTLVKRGATLGANATIICGVELGKYCFVAAGAVITKDVLPHALVTGVPAKQIGWVSHTGSKLPDSLICPDTSTPYIINEGKLSKAPSSIA